MKQKSKLKPNQNKNRFKIIALAPVGAAHSSGTTAVTAAIWPSGGLGCGSVRACSPRGREGFSASSGGRLGLGRSNVLCPLELRNLGLLKGVFRLVGVKALADPIGCVRCGERVGVGGNEGLYDSSFLPGSVRISNTVCR